MSSNLSACRETERNWDQELADDVKGECEEKYGPVEAIKVEKESQVLSLISVEVIQMLIKHTETHREKFT